MYAYIYHMKTGIYAIINTLNAKMYIGSTVNFNRRSSEHLRELKAGHHHASKLQRAFNKYSEDAFAFVFLKECNREDLIKEEQKIMDTVKPFYNSLKRAGVTPSTVGQVAWNKGIPQSEDQKKAHSKIMKGRVSGAKGKKWSEESKKAISIARTGLPAKNRMAIEQYTLDNVFIKEFSSQAEAERETGSKGITHAINGKYKHVNGFIWKKKERSQLLS